MTARSDDVLEPVDGFEITPAWSGGVASVSIVVDEFYKNGESIETRALSPDEARGLARHLTLMAEVAEHGLREDPRLQNDE
jgi:hypothetical protein